MINVVLAITVLFTLALPITGFANETTNMREGYWEMITSMDLPGSPVKMAPTSMKHCFTKEDVKDQKKSITTDRNCTVSDLKQSGNKVTWKMKCTGKSAGVFNGETVYKSDSFDTAMRMETQGQTMNMKIRAKRLGNCP
jgi:hypothetical protein